MSLSAVLDALDLLDSSTVTGERVAGALQTAGIQNVDVVTLKGTAGSTDVVRLVVPGTRGRGAGGEAPTLGIIGRLGGIGARPARIGLVSDADGAVAAVAVALKLARMARDGDRLPGDVFISTNVCPDAPTVQRPPVPMMRSPVDVALLYREEIRTEMEAVLSVDTTRGNRIINHRGIAVSPPVKQGWILHPPDELLTLLSYVTGRMPVVMPLATQDITPYGNDLLHINSILQPSTVTSAPVVGVAITAEVAVPGSATGASQAVDIDLAVRFSLEVAKAYGAGECRFYDASEWEVICRRYGPLTALQTLGRE
jgi:hypothetical protein